MANRPSPSKVAIPRLRKPENDSTSIASRVGMPRVQKACDNCHTRKVRCSGERPRCQNCLDQPSPCTYPLTRKDRLKDATEHVGQLVALMKDLGAHVDNAGQQKIDGLLDSLGECTSKPSVIVERMEEKSLRSTPSRVRLDANTEADVPGSVGSKNDVNLVDEDLFRSHESRATGFVGHNSAIQWIRDLKTKIDSQESVRPTDRLPFGFPGSGNEAEAHRGDALDARQKSSSLGTIRRISDSTVYLDNDNLDVDIVVDPYEMPLPEEAERLFDCYMQTVHSSFPILPDEFEAQFIAYNESMRQNRPYQIPKDWQAMLNLVFAIGAQYSHLIQAEWRADARDHLIYMNRATRILGLDKLTTTFPAPRLSSIQAIGLLSLYYLTIGQVSRAWMMIGISLRFALAAGLHLRNDDPSASPSKKAILIEVWWSLHSIESLLCTLIGRPCVIPNGQCTVPLPTVSPEEGSLDGSSAKATNPVHWRDNNTTLLKQSSSGTSSRGDSDTVTRTSYLGACVTMGLAMQKALSSLYSPRATADSWEQVQKEIDSLSKELDDWVAAALPAELRPANSLPVPGIQRERLLLSFQYHSAKLLIYRPCLCRLEQRTVEQSDASSDFNQKAAEACIEAAQAVTSLLPDQPDVAFVYQQSPWWCIVHYIMQAIAVFLLKMSFSQTHVSRLDESILLSTKKLTRWLQSMSVNSAVARRAYDIVVDIIKAGAPRLPVDISNILTEGEAGQGHSSQTYAWPQNTELPPHHEDSFLRDKWEMPPINNPTATTDFGTQYPTASWGQQSAQNFGVFQPGQNVMLDPQLPLMFGNPFLTAYDLPNPLLGEFFSCGDASMNAA